jgi:hypothetical protein
VTGCDWHVEALAFTVNGESTLAPFEGLVTVIWLAGAGALAEADPELAVAL